MKKRPIQFMILSLLLFALLSGCASTSSSAETSESATPTETAAPTEEAQETATPSPVPDTEEQSAIIMEMYDGWKPADDGNSWYYAITDLDRNGRCEVIVASTQGTGLYTTALVYELNENYNGLAECPYDLAEGDSGADIITDSAKCFYDATNGIYYYLFNDVIRNGAAESWYSDVAVWLKDGEVHQQVIAVKHTTFDANNNETVEYLRDGETISEEEYQSAISVFFSGMESTDVLSLNWTEIKTEATTEPSLIYAADLYNGYGFTHQLCDKTGVYDFSPVNSDGVEWEVYILDEEFTDAERFIPQAYRCALKGLGSLEIFEGQWIYVYCPCNVWTSQTAPAGCAYSWGINPDKEVTGSQVNYRLTEETQNTASTGSSIVITKHPSGETVAEGGHTWFIAHADNATSLTWMAVDPNGNFYSLEDACSKVSGLELEDLGDDTLAVRNITKDFSGWGLAAVFKNDSESVTSNVAYITVS